MELKLRVTKDIPGITFNGDTRFKGKSKLIKMLRESNTGLSLRKYNFYGEEFSVANAFKMLITKDYTSEEK